MPTPVKITYRHLPPSSALNDVIHAQVARLDELGENLIECRVVVDEPNHHHRAKHFHVEVVLLVAGAELVVDRDAESTANDSASQAVRASFDAIRRQLQDHRHRQLGQTRGHALALPH